MNILVAAQIRGVTIRLKQLEEVNGFTYLGSLTDSNRDVERNVKCQTGMVTTVNPKDEQDLIFDIHLLEDQALCQ